MNEELQLKLQAYLDGELPEAEAREVAAWLAQDSGAVGLMTELKNTRAALALHERGVNVPESREFYWSKIRREIERSDAAAHRPAPAPVSPFKWLRRALAPGMGLALVVATLFLITRPGTTAPGLGLTVATADAGTFTYRNFESGATLVWLPYPAENRLAGGGSGGNLQQQ
ncbi:MAG TPA: hypothetical protein VL527_10550 [Dongiaceae bacterium]|jgi:anti-sigma factor RsiW|nr:hypothetical protein [Dongiaceae bacterium]